ncbi:DUF421 domain-containing protein [Polyangium jinanense]
MNLVLRAVCVYMALLIVFRIAGKRALVTVTTFDFLLLLIISECTQQALLGQDYSVTGAIILVGTLVSLELGLSWLKCRSTRFERWLDGTPLVIIEEGRILRERLAWLSVDEEDILEAAHVQHGLLRLDQIRYAIVERNGAIAIIPWREGG